MSNFQRRKRKIIFLCFLLNVLCSGEESEQEEAELSGSVKVRLATCIFVLITVLLMMSSFFEYMKDLIIESTSEKMKPVMEVLFSEMTVLGFLSLVTFCISKAGVLSDISQIVFSDVEDGKGWLVELLEAVHYDLFLVMVLFIIQTLALIQLGVRSEKEWFEMDNTFSKFELVDSERNKIRDSLDTKTAPQWWEFPKKANLQKAYALFEHGSLKKEFLRGRGVMPPFEPQEETSHLPPNFDYSQYLTICLSKFMANIIEMNVRTWMLLEVFLVFFYILMAASESNIQFLMVVWVLIGYCLAFGMYQMSMAARWRVEMSVNPCDMPSGHNDFQAESIFHFHPDTISDNASSVCRRPSAVSTVDDSQPRTRESSPLKPRSGQTTMFSSYLKGAVAEEHGLPMQKKSSMYSSMEEQRGVVPKDHEHLQELQPWRKSSHVTLTHATYLDKGIDFEKLPGWCHLQLPEEEKYPAWKKKLFGIGVNRQLMLYFFQCNGPKYNLMIMRILLFMHAVYVAILVLEFYESVLQLYGTNGLVAYVVIGLIPSVLFFWMTIPTIKDTVHTDHVGCLKNPKEINLVLRDMKMKKAINALILLKNLQAKLTRSSGNSRRKASSFIGQEALARDVSVGSDDALLKSQQSEIGLKEDFKVLLQNANEEQKEELMNQVKEKLGEEQFNEICRMFDLYDTDKGGEIDVCELQNLMKSLGKTMDEREALHTMKTLDINGDGSVSKLEFLIWHSESNENVENLTAEEIAKGLFEFFDEDGSGTITAKEFMTKLTELDVGLTLDEITDLIRELDEDGDNTISEEEFASLLKKHTEI